jgi:hypothetical protein
MDAAWMGSYRPGFNLKRSRSKDSVQSLAYLARCLEDYAIPFEL